MIDRQVSQLEVTYERMCSVLKQYGGKPPTADEAGSMRMMAEFCWAVGATPHIALTPLERADPAQPASE